MPQKCAVELQGDKVVFNWTLGTGGEDTEQVDKRLLELMYLGKELIAHQCCCRIRITHKSWVLN